MDEQRAVRIEGLLHELVRDSMPRREFEERFNRLEDKVDDATEKLIENSVKLEASLEKIADHEGRLDEVEKITIPAEHQERRRYVIRPMLITAAGIVVNAFLAIFTFVVGAHHG